MLSVYLRWISVLSIFMTVPAVPQGVRGVLATDDAPGVGLSAEELFRHHEPLPVPGGTQAEMLIGGRLNTSIAPSSSASAYMREALLRKSKEECLPDLMGAEGFLNPEAGLEKYIGPTQKLYMVGDSVIGQLCQLGSPGLCCSSNRPCEGLGRFPGGNWEVQLDNQAPYSEEGWQHLLEFKIRSSRNTGFGTGYIVAPQVTNDLHTIDKAVQLVSGFLEKTGKDSKDVLILGMLGNHFNGDLEVFDKYINQLVRFVVNPFPGRVVLLGYSPQHFAKTGHYSGVKDQACTPQPYPGEISPPSNSLRSSIFIYNVWARLTNPRSRLVDLYEVLMPLWNCHRHTGDCTHWKDTVISLQAQLVLNALEHIPLM